MLSNRSANVNVFEPFGLLNVSKPRGKTSFEVVGLLRKLLHVKKVGHTGTLDPIASGVLLLCVGRATRLLEYLMALPKSYVAWMKLGVTTDTLDSTGKVLQVREVPEFSPEDVELVLSQFRGELKQVPPMFSAIKRDGRKLYVLARQGVQANVEPRDITIHKLELQSLSASTVQLEISCSKGTYIRSLCADIGEKLGCGAHVFKLQRTKIGPWEMDNALPYSRVFALSRDEILDQLEPIEHILPDFARGEVSPVAEHYALNGLSIDIDQVRLASEIAMGDPVILRTWRGELIGIFRATEPSGSDLERRPSLPMVLRPEKILLTSSPPKRYPSRARKPSGSRARSRRPYRKGRGQGNKHGRSRRRPNRRPPTSH
ncbi:MAG: tRNA pseudouridine(55) synthase TruB [Candidatus Coatesbacteria bacterium]|nr:MAG: tRNA pseudouridine(55) synthase TruB [Candidatus Coatesbacteria bacterium]